MSKDASPDEARTRELRDEFFRLREARDASEGKRVLTRTRGLANSLDVFRGNYAELKRFLDGVAEFPAAIMFAQALPREHEAAQREAARLLHNYVAAAFSLKGAAGAFVDRHYAGTTLRKDYEARVKKDFADSPLHRFMQQLRNHTMHNRLPPTKAVTRFGRDVDLENGFWLDAKRLREEGDFTGKAREYLASLGDEAKLDDIADAYEPVVVGFYRWFSGRIREEHADAIEETHELERQMKEAERRAYPDRR